ncbi:ion channel [Shimia sp.]|uniref:potassium channel family protein n=1 Tax=Shimia sp. TaxID=1954381 RepID=UPI003298EFEE
MAHLKAKINELYTGNDRRSVQFRYVLILFDAVTIIFFVGTAHLRHGPGLIVLSQLVGLIILADLVARLWIAEDRMALFSRLYTIADVVVILSLFFDPFLSGNVAFLRVLRGLRLIHSYQLMNDLRRDSRFFRMHEETLLASVNLFIFIMVTTSIVLVFFLDPESTRTPFIDALYFTVATLTTTGFGDITLGTPAGKVFSVVVMAIGVALFVRLAQAVFQPNKVRCECMHCGLLKHDQDAVHCKHCGETIRIETEGF